MLEVLTKTTFRTAVRGHWPFGESSVIHALRNALIPVILTVSGLQVGNFAVWGDFERNRVRFGRHW